MEPVLTKCRLLTPTKETRLHRHGDTAPLDVVSTGGSRWGRLRNMVRRTRTIGYRGVCKGESLSLHDFEKERRRGYTDQTPVGDGSSILLVVQY